MKSVMQHSFSQIPDVRVQRSSFNRSHGYKTTFNAGYLIPVFVDEALPGDTFNCKMTSFARMATPLHPVMDNMKLDSFFFLLFLCAWFGIIFSALWVNSLIRVIALIFLFQQ